MTDKQIIIDNVDVSGCESFCNGICCKVGFGDDASCKLFSDCHYKNWKRKEQECEELKKIIDEAKNSKLDLKSFLVGEAIQNEYEQQLDQLKAENEELKDKLNCCFCNPYVELNNIEKQRKCVEVTECFRQQLDQLKADNDELKKIIKRLNVPKHEVIDMDIALENEMLKAENEELKEKINKFLDERNNYLNNWGINLIYKQTLAEIKEIAEKHAPRCADNVNCNYECEACHLSDLKQILQKISEVLDVCNT